MRRGEVWWANLEHPWGRRPVLLVARDEAYGLLSRVMVAPLTTTIRRIPTAVPLDPQTDGVDRPCVVSMDSISAIPVAWLDRRLTTLRPAVMSEVDRAIRFALALGD